MKVRVYEVAQELGLDNKTTVSLFRSIGVVEVRNHMSSVRPKDIEALKRHVGRPEHGDVVEERILPTVVKRRPNGSASRPRQPRAELPQYGWAAVPKVDVLRELVVTVGRDAAEISEERRKALEFLARNEWGPFIVEHTGLLTEASYARDMATQFRCRHHAGVIEVVEVRTAGGYSIPVSEGHVADVYGALLVLVGVTGPTNRQRGDAAVLEAPDPEDPTRVVVVRIGTSLAGERHFAVGSRQAPAPHMRRAHRRRQPCGPKGMDRKTTWVRAASVRGGRTWAQYRVVE